MTLQLVPQPCAECDGSGWRYDRTREAVSPCPHRGDALALRLRYAGVPAPEAGLGWHTSPREAAPEVLTALDRARRELEAALMVGRSVLMLGPNGGGKTVLGVGALRWGIENGLMVRYAFVPDWLASLGQWGDESLSARHDLARYGLVLLDDLGWESYRSDTERTEWARQELGLLIDALGKAGTIVVATTNLAETRRATLHGEVLGVREQYGARIWSRIAPWARIEVRVGVNLRGGAA